MQVVENYPDDPRGHSALVLGFTEDSEPLYAVWSMSEDTGILITSIGRTQIVDGVAEAKGKTIMKAGADVLLSKEAAIDQLHQTIHAVAHDHSMHQ
jgi:hypothetical protein